MALTISSILILSIISSGFISPEGNAPTGSPASDFLPIIRDAIFVGGTDISDTFLFEEWDDADGADQDTIESIALSATDAGEDDGIDDGSMIADGYLNLNLDDSSDDYLEVLITVCFRTNPGE